MMTLASLGYKDPEVTQQVSTCRLDSILRSTPLCFLFLFSFHSDGVNATIEYILEIYSISPQLGSLMGGTALTVSGSGFSNNTVDNKVSVGKQNESQLLQTDSLPRQRSPQTGS